jgi:hypothetical protein
MQTAVHAGSANQLEVLETFLVRQPAAARSAALH